MSILEQTKTKMNSAIDHFKNELKNIRTGRANPGMVEHVLVEAYGSQVRLKDVASISSPDPRSLLITPFDPVNVPAAAKGIERANLGFMPQVDGNVIRIRIPQMTQEIRDKMKTLCSKEKEEAKITIRNIRRDANESIKKLKADGKMAEDEFKKAEKDIQKLTDDRCKEADDLSAKKEKEIEVI